MKLKINVKTLWVIPKCDAHDKMIHWIYVSRYSLQWQAASFYVVSQMMDDNQLCEPLRYSDIDVFWCRQ